MDQIEQKAIEEMTCENCLYHLACLVNGEYVPSPCCAYEDKAGYSKQEWISVDERLPDECKNVLCFDGNKTIIAFMEKTEDCGEYVPVFWDWIAYDRDDTWNEVCATHWMPLPEPPMMKGGAE